MFGSTNPFGQSSNSPFGSQPPFGQQNNSNSNPFAPKPFGSTNPFGSQTGSSMFGGGTSTGVFGAAQTSSPFSSNTTFGASSSPAFGSSVPTFGQSSTPAFGNSASSSAFGGSSAFGQKPAFGGFGSTPPQTSPFGSATQPSQPAFGNSVFGSSTPFGASTQPTFGSTSTPAFGATSTPAFGATSTPAFGATSTPAFGSTPSPTFGSTGSAFGMSTAPGFGGGGGFGASSNPMFGSASTSAFGTSSSPFGASSAPAFGASPSSTPAFSFGSSQAFGQSSSAFGSSSPFGSTTSAFGGQSSAFGSQTPTQAFGNPGIGQPGFGGQRGGSRIANYTPTTEPDSGTSGQTAKLESISAMPTYKDKSHEELRWEDYQLGDKGGPLPSAQSSGLSGFNSSTTQTNTFGPSPAFAQSSPNPFSSTTPSNSNPFAPNNSAFPSGFGVSAPSFSSSAFGPSTSATTPFIFSSTSASPFAANSSPSQNFGAPTSLFNSAPALSASQPFGSPFGASSAAAFGASPSSTPAFSFGSSQAFGQSSSAFGSSRPFGSTTSAFGGQSSAFGFGGQRGGSRIANYTPTTEPDSGTSGQTAKLESISAMPTYKDKSHEELRWEDYQLGDKGGPLPSAQSAGLSGFNSSTTQTNTFGPSPAFAQSSPNPFSSTTPSNSNPFAPNNSAFPSGFGVSAPSFSSSAFGPSTSATTPSIFSSTSASPFAANSSPSQNFGAPTSLFNSAPALSASQPFGSPFGASSAAAFGASPSSTPAFSFGSSQAFGQSSSAFGSSRPFGSTTSAFGGQSSAFGSQTPTQAFGNPGIGQPGFGGQRGGSRIANYTPTTEPDSGTSGQTAKLESISAMPTYKDKSHEELRWEDYQLGDKGGPLPSAQSAGLSGFNSSTTQTNTFGPSPAFAQSSPNPFSSTTPSNSNPFAPNNSAFPSGFGVSAPSFSSSAFGPSTSATTPSIFSSTSASPFAANSSPSQNFGAPTSLFNSAPALSASQPFGSPFGASSAAAFGASPSSTPAFSFGSSQAFGQSSSAFGSSRPFGSTTSAFGGQSSAFGSQTPTQAFGNPGIGQPGFGGQRGGSRIANYTPTTEPDSGTSGQTAKLESISAMPTYKDKSHEDLRWEDYQLGDKGGPLPSAQSAGLSGFNSSTTQTNTFGPSPAFAQSSPNPFSSTTPSNSTPFAPNNSAFPSGFGVSAPSFSSSAFGPSTSATTPSIFSSTSASPFAANSSPSQNFGAPTSLFNSAPALSASQPFGSNLFSNTQSSQLFSSTPTLTSQPVSGFGQQNPSPFGQQNSSPFGQPNPSPFGQQTTSFTQSSMFSSPSSGFGGSLFSTSAPLASSNLTGFGQTAVTAALRKEGLESSNLVLGIDFTKSNEWTGKISFNNKCLHAVGNTPNPYEKAISIIGKTIAPFDDDNLIPCFGFGDATTHDHEVFSFHSDHSPCHGFEEVLACYQKIVPNLRLSGPTSYAPVIEAAIDLVEKTGGQFHVLVIVADGQVTRSVNTEDGELSPQEERTIKAIVDASSYALSIILVGVGDGPWEDMKKFDDKIPARDFDNFQFVNFTDIMSKKSSSSEKEAAFALAALMEIPFQYKAAIEFGLLGRATGRAKKIVPRPPPVPYSRPVPPARILSNMPESMENERNQMVCAICLTNAKDLAFGCGHMTCRDCGARLKNCHICRERITSRLRLFTG